MSDACYLCHGTRLTRVIDVGPQPISNRYLKTPSEPEEMFPIALKQCTTCGVVQIDMPVPASALVPPGRPSTPVAQTSAGLGLTRLSAVSWP